MPNKQTSIHNFNIGLQNNFFMHGKAELINQTCHTKTFSQNMEIHKKKILLNIKNWRCILYTDYSSLEFVFERKYVNMIIE